MAIAGFERTPRLEKPLLAEIPLLGDRSDENDRWCDMASDVESDQPLAAIRK